MNDHGITEVLMFFDFGLGDFLMFIWNIPLTLIIAISGTIYGWIWYRPFHEFGPRQDLLPSWITYLIIVIAYVCWIPYIFKLLILIKVF